MSYRYILCVCEVLLLFTRSKFSTLHLLSFSFSRSEISYICKFMPNCLHLIRQSCSSKLEGMDPEKTQASFLVFSSAESLLCQKLPDFSLLLGLAIWLALDLQLKLSGAAHAHNAAELWNHPRKRFADRQFSHCSFSELKHWPQSILPVNSYTSSCNNERQDKLYAKCAEIHTLHPSLFPDDSPAQNILAVIIPYVEWHNVWSIISTSAFWRTAEPPSSGKQIQRRVI